MAATTWEGIECRSLKETQGSDTAGGPCKEGARPREVLAFSLDREGTE